MTRKEMERIDVAFQHIVDAPYETFNYNGIFLTHIKGIKISTNDYKALYPFLHGDVEKTIRFTNGNKIKMERRLTYGMCFIQSEDGEYKEVIIELSSTELYYEFMAYCLHMKSYIPFAYKSVKSSDIYQEEAI
jgi:hypothetical protein